MRIKWNNTTSFQNCTLQLYTHLYYAIKWRSQNKLHFQLAWIDWLPECGKFAVILECLTIFIPEPWPPAAKCLVQFSICILCNQHGPFWRTRLCKAILEPSSLAAHTISYYSIVLFDKANVIMKKVKVSRCFHNPWNFFLTNYSRFNAKMDNNENSRDAKTKKNTAGVFGGLSYNESTFFDVKRARMIWPVWHSKCVARKRSDQFLCPKKNLKAGEWTEMHWFSMEMWTRHRVILT